MVELIDVGGLIFQKISEEPGIGFFDGFEELILGIHGYIIDTSVNYYFVIICS